VAMPAASAPPDEDDPAAAAPAAAEIPSATALTQALLAWYDAAHRTLPWRPERPEDRDAYRTWLSEIMLQQTRVETVKPYYARFLGRFPTVQALAAAPLDEVLGLWAGLGYYSRARNLHAAAQQVAEAGAFPATVEGLQGLPGVGPYVAAAVGSIALGRDAAAVDGNVVRVLSRLWAEAGGPARIQAHAQALLPAGRAGDFNQALMDLGSAVCTPRNPACLACPLAPGCQALRQGRVADFPPAKARRVVPERAAVALVLYQGPQVLLARRPAEGLFGGLYELPGDMLAEGEDPADAAVRVAWSRLGLRAEAGLPLGRVQHTLTHMHLLLHVLPLRVSAPAASAAPTLAWYTAGTWADPAQPGELGLSTLSRKALRLLSPAGGAATPRRR